MFEYFFIFLSNTPEKAVRDDKVMQDFDLESLPRGVIIPKR